tara:strand:+ start:9105 stop:9737 length:633 start_codon:yes stop_codon:yes gene_type:complete
MTKTFLHVGCGNMTKEGTTPVFNTDEWKEVRADIDENVNPDIIASMTDMSAINDKSYDAVYSSHNIEHLYAHEVPTAVNEFSRVLKKNGFLIITCPDLKSVCHQVSKGNLTGKLYESQAGPITAIDILYGLRPALAVGNYYMAHKVGFTADLLKDTLTQFGFQQAIVAAVPSRYVLWGIATKNDKIDSLELFEILKTHTDLLKETKVSNQ